MSNLNQMSIQKHANLVVSVIFFVISLGQVHAQKAEISNLEISFNRNVSQEEGRSTTNNPRFNDLMLPKTNGVFRGISFDMSKEEVLEIESLRTTVEIFLNETVDELVVTSDMGREILDFADTTYRFDEQGLYAIKVETYANTSEGALIDFNQIIAYFSAKYGEPIISDADGYYEFTATDEVSGNEYLIALKNITDVEDSYGMYMYFDLL